jgi:hypothetical protein
MMTWSRYRQPLGQQGQHGSHPSIRTFRRTFFLDAMTTYPAAFRASDGLDMSLVAISRREDGRWPKLRVEGPGEALGKLARSAVCRLREGEFLSSGGRNGLFI